MAAPPVAEQLNLKVKSQVSQLLPRMENKSFSKSKTQPNSKNWWTHTARDNR